MSKKENRSIAYIYDEMDPSEKVEFERELEKDNNLLIEVEAFKFVKQNLNKLQEIQPPNELVESICDRAARQKGQTRNHRIRVVFYAAAALLLAGMTSGIFLMDGNETTREETHSERASVSNTSVFPRPMEQSAENTSISTQSPGDNGKLSPWVDNNEVIHFHDRFRPEGAASMDSMFRHSFQKLTPVKDPSQSGQLRQHLHLTGSRR